MCFTFRCACCTASARPQFTFVESFLAHVHPPTHTHLLHHRVLLPRYWAAAEQLLPEYNLRHLAALATARAKLGNMPTRRWCRSLWRAVHVQLQQLLLASTRASTAAGEANAACSSNSSSSALHEQQQAAAAAFQTLLPSSEVLSPAVVSQLLWGAGKLWQKAPVPWPCLRLLLAAAVATMPQCSLTGLTAVGVGLRAMLHSNSMVAKSGMALRQLRTRQARQRKPGLNPQHGSLRLQQKRAKSSGSSYKHRHRTRSVRRLQQQAQRPVAYKSSSSRQRLAHSDGIRRRAAAARATSHELWQLACPLWAAWFCRGTQLLLLQANSQAVAPQPPPPSSAASIPKRHARQAAGLCSSEDISVQLRVVVALRLQPPAEWLHAVVAAAQQQVPHSSSEQLSWLLLDLLKVVEHSTSLPGVTVEQLLPKSFVAAVLSRARVVHASSGEGGWSPAQMQRLQSVFRRLRQCSGAAVSASEWQQWLRLMMQWRASQGLPALTLLLPTTQQ